MFNTGKDKEVKTVYQTNDYEKFVFSKSNRDVKLNRKLVEEIQSIGQVSPIVVSKDDGVVIDGQHRLTALKELNFPVEYILTSNSVDSLPDTNAAQTSWKMKDYLNFYSSRGYKHYQDFEEFTKQADGYVKNIMVLIALANNVASGTTTGYNSSDFKSLTNVFKSGDFKFDDYKESNNRLNELISFSIQTGLEPNKHMYDAWRMLRNAGTDMENLIESINRIDVNSEISKKRLSVTSYLEIFREAYNKGKRKHQMIFASRSNNSISKISFD